MTNYPRIEALGITITYDTADANPAPPGISGDELQRVLSAKGLWERWCEWSIGSTFGPNGAYPWDIERFLSGKQVID